jgi:hypothetical protein
MNNNTGIEPPTISNRSVAPTAPPPGFYLDTATNTVKPVPKMTFKQPTRPVAFASDEMQARRLRETGIYSQVIVAKPRYSEQELEDAF